MRQICFLLLIFLALQSGKGLAQTDTLRLDIKQAEYLFRKQNYDLLAENFQIDQARADIITARLWDNPELEHENLFYNHETKKFLQTSYEYGQFASSVSQLFKLAGKRNKNIKMAQFGVKMAEFAYFDLIRTLSFELHHTFYNAYFTQQSVRIYQQQIEATSQLLTAYEVQMKMGNVALKDVIRIKSLILNLKSELTSVLNELEDNQRDLRLICGLTPSAAIELQLSAPGNDISISSLHYQSLVDSARVNRSDLKLAKTDLEFQKMNLKLQKAMAIPDVELSLSYDLKGNYPEKYTGLGIKIPLPLFNRNQGEIKKAMTGIDASENNIRKQESILENEVFNVYKTVFRNEKLCNEIDPSFSTDFDKLISALIKNFKARNISLIEFLDLFDSYKENSLQLNKLQQNRMNARAELNFVTGTTIFR
ncbi:TolC family protein [Pedobacter frigidisoli]|uniref:TolC family protein n=1 Tax=Pedobacter frigidisoli TaxID=2530455 RepID=UPI00293169AB|nr:TolC family protein [Pedobacter frigidisoli]